METDGGDKKLMADQNSEDSSEELPGQEINLLCALTKSPSATETPPERQQEALDSVISSKAPPVQL